MYNCAVYLFLKWSLSPVNGLETSRTGPKWLGVDSSITQPNTVFFAIEQTSLLYGFFLRTEDRVWQ